MSLSKPLPSYINNPQIEAFEYETIPDRIQYFAKLHPNKTAFADVDGNGDVISSITFGDLYQKSVEFGKGLIAKGITKGDMVGIVLSNTPEWLYCSFGTLCAGGIPLHLEFVFKDGSDICDIIEKAGRVKALVVAADKGEENIKICENVFGILPDDGHLQCSRFPKMKTIIFSERILSKPGSLTIGDVISEGQRVQRDLPYISPEDDAILFLTSGTTGTQKIIPQNHMRFLHVGCIQMRAFEMNENSIYFNCQPLSWAGAAPHDLVRFGITRLSCDPILLHSENGSSTLLRLLEKQRCTTAMIYPSLCIKLSKENHRFQSEYRLDCVWTGGIPVPAACRNIVPNIAKTCVPCYGCSEIGFISSMAVDSAMKFEDFDTGYPLEGSEVKIVDSQEKVVPRNTKGEIYVRKNFSGYLNEPAKTGRVIAPSGWYRTDDVGLLTEEGHLVVLGRNSDMIKVANETEDVLFSPVEMEQVIMEMPGIADVCVFPITNEYKLVEIYACVETEEDKKIGESDISLFIQNQVVEYTSPCPIVPRKYIFLEKLPRNSVGKLIRKKVVSEALKQMERNA